MMIENRENKANLNNKNLKIVETNNPNVKFVVGYAVDAITEPELSTSDKTNNQEVTTKKPEPKHTKKRIINIGSKKQSPSNWKTIVDTVRFSENGNYVKPAEKGAAPPAMTPGPCCMNDLYAHQMNTTFGNPYVWNALAGPYVAASVPESIGVFADGSKYNIIPTDNGSTSGGDFVNGVWNFNVLSSNLNYDKTIIWNTAPVIKSSVDSNFGTAFPQNTSVVLRNFLDYTWNGALDAGYTGGGSAPRRNIGTTYGGAISSQSWSFSPILYDTLFSNQTSPGMQTQLDWSNSVSAYNNFSTPTGTQYQGVYNWGFVEPELMSESNGMEYGIVTSYTNPLSPIFSILNPFCQGRALINPGQPTYPNPWPGKSHTYTQGGTFNDGTASNPRRMGWEGWVLRPTNVDWNWGNRGAFKDILHYTLGPAEQGAASTANPYIDTYGYPHQWGNVLDGKSCSDGYCDYPIPSPIMIANLSYPGSPAQWVKAPSKYFYGYPHIEYSQLYHQRICCSNSQWFQNARVLRNYTEEVWNIIGSPFAGGSPKITLNEDQLSEFDLNLAALVSPGLVGTNGNGPPEGNTDAFQAKFSCTTYSTLNRILQYISSPSDFEEIYALDFGNYKNGLPKPGTQATKIWFPVQAGYYNKNTNDINADDPWENMYRLRDVGRFYTMINLCGQSANESLSLGELGNLGNPPIAQYDTVYGTSDSKLNPGIWPWGHCITYACGNPEYSPNYDSGTTSSGNKQVSGAKGAPPRANLLTYNKLGERGCEAQTPWAQMPLNYYYSNVTFAGIKIHFYDESTGEMTSKMFRKWSFSNSNEWVGMVPPTYEEASESAIGFMMWLGHNSWDYNMTNPTAYPNSTQAGLYGPSVGRPAGSSGGTGVEYWEPVNTDMFNTPYTEGHFVASLSNTTQRASINGYYKGIRPNYNFLDVVTHLLKMEEEWPLKHSNPNFDYNNRPTGVPEYIAGVAVPNTQKVDNPQTGIPAYWWNQNPVGLTTLPDGYPYYYQNQFHDSTCCARFPGESNTNPHRDNSAYPGQPWTNLPPTTDPSWNGLKDGPGNPGGGNYCKQSYMVNTITLIPNVALQLAGTPPSYGGPTGGVCNVWDDLPDFYQTNNYLPGCFKPGDVGTNTINDSNAIFHNNCFASGDVRGVFQDRTINCVCPPWYSKRPIKEFIPSLLTGPHCEGCNVGCCTNEFNSTNRCEYVYPQGLFKSKWDCMRAHRYESDTIPSSVPALFAQQNATTPFGRRKTYTSPLGDTTFCKLRPEGIRGCLNSHALNYSPSHTEDCSGSIAWTYRNSWNLNLSPALLIDVDNSCCEYNKPGYMCDTLSDIDNDGMGDCLQTCTYGIQVSIVPWLFGTFTFYGSSTMEPEGCYSAKTECDPNCGPFNPTTLPGYSCNYPNTPYGCAQNCVFNIANPTSACPYSSMTQCMNNNGGSNSPHCSPQSGWLCTAGVHGHSSMNGVGRPLSQNTYDPNVPIADTSGPTAGRQKFQNFYDDTCSYVSNYWGSSNSQLLYNSEIDCLADCNPCVGTTAKGWCGDIKSELQNQFGSQWTEANINSSQFDDPNPVNQPYPYSPTYNSSWYFKYEHCCKGRIASRYKYNDAEEYALKSGQAANIHSSNWQPPNLGFRFPAPGNRIKWHYDNPGWWCANASNQDKEGDFSTNAGNSYTFTAGQGYKIKNQLALSGNLGPDGVCEDESVKTQVMGGGFFFNTNGNTGVAL